MISTRGRYALRVMIDIAENSGGRFLPLIEIAERQGISEKYLDYTVGSILRVTEVSLAPVACLKEEGKPCERQNFCKTLPLWQGLNELINGYLDGVTLADLARGPRAV